ncbi:DNA-formamidopyrimidine glycosylase family protein [Flavihumibacter solisilvae]|uniref:Formamidopyrimidine-DNA glycosylase catalytic domain-containing protein n=1 Tax=Flavihumibacter solisilvae TaxID=1349421 RepID=A0A0C1L0I6_9BACT|nr:DNA-formamidopyrimidine glycosylase family protein [Flavihumibacter solisilvae]KIC93046.1 hypothetical protein OI18_20105 [Flavihumibacter solisilvae]
MPELPDLEVFSANLNRELKGRILEDIKVSRKAKLNVTKRKLSQALKGQRLTGVYREGKMLYFYFRNKNVLALHMMLRGKLYRLEDENPIPYTLFEFDFDGDKKIGLADYLGSAHAILNPEETGAPDALDKKVNQKFWKEKLQSRASIKNLLLDQHVVRGIGSAYADEILWESGISPFSISNKIPVDAIKRLAKAIPKILKHAVKQIRKEAPKIIGGEIRDFLLVHNARHKKSPGGAVIKVTKKGGRKTYYTNEQQLFK